MTPSPSKQSSAAPSRAIPQTDPGASYRAYQAELAAAARRTLEGGWYILGHEVSHFEAEFAAYIGVGHGIGVANGTDAVELSLRAAGVGAGDVVFTVSHTAVATVAAIERAGAIPVLVDIDPAGYTLDPARLDEAVRAHRSNSAARAAAVVVVHLYGHPADMASILDVAARFDLTVIEDCAQAHGALLAGKRVGSMGRLAAFSFYPTKNLGAFGDGGAIVTDDAALAEKVRWLREYGWRERYISAIPGLNSRLDELHAAMLRVKLRGLDADNDRRRAVAALYDGAIAEAGAALSPPAVREGAHHVYHQYIVRSGDRDRLRAFLQSRGVGTAIHYPMAVHQQPAYAGRVAIGPGGLEQTERAVREVLSLPMFPQLLEEEAERVMAALRQWTAAPQ